MKNESKLEDLYNSVSGNKYLGLDTELMLSHAIIGANKKPILVSLMQRYIEENPQLEYSDQVNDIFYQEIKSLEKRLELEESIYEN